MTLNSQSEELIHFQSESANGNSAQIKTNVERFCVMTLSNQSEALIHFQSDSTIKNCEQIKANASLWF